jgi:hypothetical protein
MLGPLFSTRFLQLQPGNIHGQYRADPQARRQAEATRKRNASLKSELRSAGQEGAQVDRGR